MDTSRDDIGIAIRSSFIQKGSKQRFSLLALILISVILIFLETIEAKPLNFFRSIIKDVIYRGSAIVSQPAKIVNNSFDYIGGFFNLHENYTRLKEENDNLKNNISKSDFLELENSQLRNLIDEQMNSPSNLLSARVMLDKQSPYLNSFIINIGSNKNIKNGMAVLDGKNFVGRIVDVNFFSSRVLLVTDLNSKIPVVIEPRAYQSILSGTGGENPILEYLPKNHKVEVGNSVYTSGKDGIFSPGIPIGKTIIVDDKVFVSLYSDSNQLSYVNVDIGHFGRSEK